MGGRYVFISSQGSLEATGGIATKPNRIVVASLLVLLGLLLIAAATATAQEEDNEAPKMRGPADKPGADVIWQQNVPYQLNATGSTDNEAIINYSWEITNPDTTVTVINTTTPTTMWTPTQYGIHKIISGGEDAAGNLAYYLYMMDVVEVLAPGTSISNTDVSYDHSVAVTQGSLSYTNTAIDITGGYPTEMATGSGPPDQLSESLTNTGPLGGSWQPYYSLYGYTQYGQVTEDTSVKLSGSKSIKISDGDYYYGVEYHFDKPQDLTKYEALTYYLHHDFNSDTSSYTFRHYYVYFYGTESYSQPYGYLMHSYYTGGRPGYYGWLPFTVCLDTEKCGMFYDYYMEDLSEVSIMRIQWYMYDYYTDYSVWIDNVGFYNPEWGDEITESATPSGDKSGYWSASGGVATSVGDTFVGSATVRATLRLTTLDNIYYYFDNPQDLSEYNGLRFFETMRTSGGSELYYSYYWRSPILYVYDENGRYAYYTSYAYSSGSYRYGRYVHYSYGSSNYGGKWYAHSLPWGPDSAVVDTGVDWTKITRFRLANIYNDYAYPSDSTLYMYIDGLDWYKPASGGAGVQKPSNRENIPHGIYSLGTGTLKMDHVAFTGDPDFGSFVRSDANLEVRNSTFDNLWGTSHQTIMNAGQTYGGILAFNANAKIYDITITGASSSGLYLENCVDLDAHNLDISGHSSSFGGSAGAIIAYVRTDESHTGKVKVSGSKFYNSEQGHGLMIMSFNALGEANVDITGVQVYGNTASGIVTEFQGYSGNLTVDVTDSTGWNNGMAAFHLYIQNAMKGANKESVVTFEDCTATGNGFTGVYFDVTKSHVGVKGIARNIETYDNGYSGAAINFDTNVKTFKALFENVTSYENPGPGMYIYSAVGKFRDFTGTSVVGNGLGSITLDGCHFHSNMGDGVTEIHDPSSGNYQYLYPEHFEVKAYDCVFEQNEGDGYYFGPDGYPSYTDGLAKSEFYNCEFTDNKRNGYQMWIDFYSYYYYGFDYNVEVSFTECTFTYNERGYYEWTEYALYTTSSSATFDRCTFENNDYEAIYHTGYLYTYVTPYFGYCMMDEIRYDIKNCKLDGAVYLDVNGLYDGGGEYDMVAYVSIVNCTYTHDEPMYIKLSTYLYTYYGALDATIIYKDNIHTSPSTMDGLHFEVASGTAVDAFIDIQNMDIYDPLGYGIYILFETTYTSSSYTRSVTGRVNMVNVDIRNPLEDGVYINTRHALPTGSSTTGFYALIDSKIYGVNTGIRTYGFSGEVRNTVFSKVRYETIYTRDGVIDVFNSEVGPISEDNLRVDEAGAIRLWFTMRVKVVWKDKPDVPVKGTTVEIKDNSWTILGVNSIDDMNGVLFSNLNAYSVLPDGIFTKNPYIITADYIGIVKEQQAQIKENSELTIYMVDNVAPRVTIESPEDGYEQREQTITVKGTSYDKHTGIDGVMVSIDNEEWFAAEMSPDKFTYEYTFEDIPEGITLIRVRGYDNAGNSVEVATSVLVDSTPPSLELFTPEDGMKTNKRYLEIVGVTDVGSNVYINDQPIDIRYTLISHTLILAEGPNAIKVASVDYLGNIISEVRYVTLDTQAPLVDIINVENGDRVNEAELTIIGMTDKDDVTITMNDEMVDIYEGRFEATLALEEGENEIMFHATDSVGNIRIVFLTVYLDRTEPWLRLVEPSTNVLTDNNFRVSGYVEQGARVFVNEREIEVAFGYFETTVSAPEGAYELLISAQDIAGNEMVSIIPLTVDTIPPVIEILHPPEGFVTNVETINVIGSIAGTSGEDMRFMELYINGIPRLFDYTTGEFSHEVLLEEGVNRIEFESMDSSGNSDKAVRTVMLDSKAPYLSVFLGNVRQDPNWNEPVSVGDFVYVSGFTEIGAALTIDGVSVDVDSETGYFNYTLSLPKPLPGLKIFTKEIVVTSRDAAGNSVTITEKANRIQGAATKEEDKTTTAEWLILFLAIVIFGMAVAGAYGYNRIQSQHEMIEAYETAPPPARVTPEGKVIAPPPARPARGGRPRPKAPVEEEDEVVIEMEEEEEEEEV